MIGPGGFMAGPRKQQEESFPHFMLHEYVESGCMQMEIPGIGAGLYRYTHGRMCDGCPAYNGGRCESLRKMIARNARPMAQSAPTETVRQEAARTGLSINEVRRRRAKDQP